MKKLTIQLGQKKTVIEVRKKNFSGDKEMDRKVVAAVRSAISKAKVCDKPIAKYDVVKKTAYIEYADGRRATIK